MNRRLVTASPVRPPRRDDYAPYHTFDAFAEGVSDYTTGVYHNPYNSRPREGVNAQAWGVNEQAWDRGAEYAMRVARYVEMRKIGAATLHSASRRN